MASDGIIITYQIHLPILSVRGALKAALVAFLVTVTIASSFSGVIRMIQNPFLPPERDQKEQVKLRAELNEELEINLDELLFDYPLWNRTLGADHFCMTCNETAVISAYHAKFLPKNAIRVGWSASYNDSDYIPHKDIVLPKIVPEFALHAGDTNLEKRTQLAIWFGKPGSDGTKQLTSMWKRDGELDINSSEKGLAAWTMDAFTAQFSSAKYYICPRGDQLIGTHIALSIHYGCIPVILYDYYVLPFNDVLDWSKFSVIIKEANVYRLKEILQAMPSSKYKELQANLLKVRRYFKWNSPPKEYDAFHMAMYELWLRHHVIYYSITDLE